MIPLQIIIVEDDAIIAQLIAQYMEEAGHKVLNICHKYLTALEALKSFNPDLVFLDINLGDEYGGLNIGKLIQTTYKYPFIYLTAHSDPDTLEKAKQTEPCGYVLKPFKAADLYTAITIGLFNFKQRKQSSELKIEELNKVALDKVSQREFEIIQDISKGLTNSQISKKQFISLNTTKWHIQNIYSKLDVKNRTSLVKKIYEIN